MFLKIGIIVIILTLSCTNRNQEQERSVSMHKFTNRLNDETSPYLLQHAHNPVDWYLWGEEAFQKAKEENKPIFLSIGYSACHWCHVMENESFENKRTAELMNELFINIKVDREERPDVDQVYMNFVQMFTGGGGWPLSVFLTPDQIPFHGGTYFPPDDRYGRPGFKKLLRMVSNYYQNNKEKLQGGIAEIQRAYRYSLVEKSGSQVPDRKAFNQAAAQLINYYDKKYGGIGKAPKFPSTPAFTLFLRRYNQDKDQLYLKMATHTLTRMRYGGIYDQIGGGFARYSTDEKWLVPHFEKMLYDNAQLAVLYLDAYSASHDDLFLKTAQEILEFAVREMRSPDGGFYASFDADSEGEEGKYYVWDKKEIIALLGDDGGEVFCRYYGVTERGNFEGKNILHIATTISDLATAFHRSEKEIEKIIFAGNKILLKKRAERIAPVRDDKVILAWNGLMLSAYARAYQITSNEKYEVVIRENISFIKKNLNDKNGLLHTSKDGKANIGAFLDDYAFLIQGLLDAYEALFDAEYLQWAIQLTEQVNRHFEDKPNGGYFFTSNTQPQLIHRMKDESDQSIPSATGIMILNQLRLHLATGEQGLFNRSESLLKKYGPMFVSNPYGYASFLNALDFYLSKPAEVIIVYREGHNPAEMLKPVFQNYLPNKMIMTFKEGRPPAFAPQSIVANRNAVDDKTTAYVCRNFTCSLPLTDVKALEEILDEH